MFVGGGLGRVGDFNFFAAEAAAEAAAKAADCLKKLDDQKDNMRMFDIYETTDYD